MNKIVCDHWDEGTKDRICADKINELVDAYNTLHSDKLNEALNAEKAENEALYKTCEATQNGTLKKEFEKADRCPVCHGVGSKLGFERDGESHEIKCPNCKGTGDDPQDTRENCHKCDGTGELEKQENNYPQPSPLKTGKLSTSGEDK